MYLIEDSNWQSVKVGDRTILPKDRNLYHSITWHYLLCHQLVEPTDEFHCYRAILRTDELKEVNNV